MIRLSKSVMVCLAATALVATTTLMPTGASAAGRGGGANWPQPGTYNWPPYAEGGNMPLHYGHRYHHCWWRHGYRHMVSSTVHSVRFLNPYIGCGRRRRGFSGERVN